MDRQAFILCLRTGSFFMQPHVWHFAQRDFLPVYSFPLACCCLDSTQYTLTSNCCPLRSGKDCWAFTTLLTPQLLLHLVSLTASQPKASSVSAYTPHTFPPITTPKIARVKRNSCRFKHTQYVGDLFYLGWKIMPGTKSTQRNKQQKIEKRVSAARWTW